MTNIEIKTEIQKCRERLQELEAKLQPMGLDEYYGDKYMYDGVGNPLKLGYCSVFYSSSYSAEKFHNLRKLSHIAYMLNGGDFVPVWGELGFCLFVKKDDNQINITALDNTSYGEIFFKTRELAEQARQYITDEELRKALL